jgi:AbiV family abortive infection protein
MPARKPLPTPRQALKGSGLAASNAWTHINCAEALHEAGYTGAGCAHLVLAVEEAVKARVLHQWQVLLKLKTDRQLRDLLYSHSVRHESATLDSMPRALRGEIALWSIDHPGQVINRRALTRLFARHPDAFPITWAKNADRERQRGMHVDWNGRSWKSPSDLTEAHYTRRLRPCLEFVVKTSALVGMFDEIKDELAESGWNIDQEEQ